MFHTCRYLGGNRAPFSGRTFIPTWRTQLSPLLILCPSCAPVEGILAGMPAPATLESKELRGTLGPHDAIRLRDLGSKRSGAFVSEG
jgi:hypothetical protein